MKKIPCRLESQRFERKCSKARNVFGWKYLSALVTECNVQLHMYQSVSYRERNSWRGCPWAEFQHTQRLRWIFMLSNAYVVYRGKKRKQVFVLTFCYEWKSLAYWVIHKAWYIHAGLPKSLGDSPALEYHLHFRHRLPKLPSKKPTPVLISEITV